MVTIDKRKENRDKILKYLNRRGWSISPQINTSGDVYQLNTGDSISKIIVKYIIDDEEYQALKEAICSIENKYKNVNYHTPKSQWN